ncbi:MAG: hypothetical protein WDW36_004843 [Sanguina aurantia]
MSANPSLVRAPTGELFPAPFPEEAFVLKRTGMMLELDGVQTSSKRWSTTGVLYLSNVRLVFVADQMDPSGLSSFDIPLAYTRNDKLNQPIFGCNNLAGQVWPAVPGGGPSGSLPPHKWVVYFKEGGIGTFYPMYYTLAERAKAAFEAQQRRDSQSQQGPAQLSPGAAVNLASKAFIDPADPSTIYLTNPTDECQRLPSAPMYAANYGEDEKYQPIGIASFFGLNKTEKLAEAKQNLLEAIEPLSRGATASDEDKEEIEQLARVVEGFATSKPLANPLLNGQWELLYTTSAGILGLSKPPPFRPSGPIYQYIDAQELTARNQETAPFWNSVSAELKPLNDKKLAVQFKTFKLFNGVFSIGAPEAAKGELSITYVDEELRVSRGDKGNLFVLRQVDPQGKP